MKKFLGVFAALVLGVFIGQTSLGYAHGHGVRDHKHSKGHGQVCRIESHNGRMHKVCR